MEIGEIGDYVIMIRFPDPKLHPYETVSHAVSYCNGAGLYIGCVCEIIDLFDVGSSRYSITLKILETNRIVELGIDFIDRHFKKELRTKNLEKLGI